jgi:hypothetical protein
MPDISTTYGGGGVTTSTSGLPAMPGVGGAQMPDFAGLMRYKLALERQRAMQEAALRDAAIKAARAQAQPQRQMMMQSQPQAQEQPTESFNDRLQREQAQQAQLRILEAQSRPMPTKLIQGPQIISGYAPDTSQLPQALLPHNAQMIGSDPQQDTFGEHQRMDLRRAATRQGGVDEALRQAAQQRNNAYYGR